MPEPVARRVLRLLAHRGPRVTLGRIGVMPGSWWWPVPPGPDEGLTWPRARYVPDGTKPTLLLNGVPFVWLRRDRGVPSDHLMVPSAVLGPVAGTVPAGPRRWR
ncbi:hypothetical protein [Streptomyces aidingensis]|nr:hypothetical protein [Streptomyces aidingensis]